jgi:putative heme iron utilization protein
MAPSPQGTTEARHAEAARGIVEDHTTGYLATLTAAGEPFGSVTSFGLDERGRPVLCISDIAEHTANARRDPRASLLVAERVEDGADPLAAGRVTLVGRLGPLDEAAAATLRGPYLERNPHAGAFVDYGDFGWWRLDVASVRYVGGYGRMGWVTAGAYAEARPDPIRHIAAGAVEHLNADHADAMLDLARALGGHPGATAASATGVDRYGLDASVEVDGEVHWARFPFAAPVEDDVSMRKAVITLVHQARSGAPPAAPRPAAPEASGPPGHRLG